MTDFYTLIGRIEKVIIKYGVMYCTANEELQSEEVRTILKTIRKKRAIVNKAETYENKLSLWQKFGLNSQTEYWIENFSKSDYSSKYCKHNKEKCLISVQPNTIEEVVKFNLFNIRIALAEIGYSDVFDVNYLQDHTNCEPNPLVRANLEKELKNLKRLLHLSGPNLSGIQDWYDSFSGSSDTLNELNYIIFKKEPVKKYSEAVVHELPPFLYYILDEPQNVFHAAYGYILSQRIPFLEKILKINYTEISTTDILPMLNGKFQPMIPSEKLVWNGPRRVLYDLFAQLSLTNLSDGRQLIDNSLASLAKFLADNVEDFPSASTIERELEKMREPQGIEKAVRGRINLIITKE